MTRRIRRVALFMALTGWAIAAPACSPSPARAPTPASALAPAPRPATGNPFAGARFYVDPAYVAKVESTVREASPAAVRLAAQLRKVESFPTAIWLDAIASVPAAARALDDARARARVEETRSKVPVVTVFVIYDLPERDCSARASSGELSVADDGEARYQRAFIDPIAETLRAHPAQRVAVIVEPDSLANLATNLSIPKCAAAAPVYRRSIARALRSLSMPNVWLYLDAGHAGWLGSERDRAAIAALDRDVLADAGGTDRIRGFATNVSNYDALRGGDLARLDPSDPCPDELTYVEKLGASLAQVGITGKAFVIDTSRNGRAGVKANAGSWCNVAGAGLGERPRAAPAPSVDAYVWIKPPGDSDGGSDPSAPGYDPGCGAGASDSLPGAPRAGRWFPAAFLQLVENATPPL